MKIKFNALLILFCLNGFVNAQTIKIHYHKGFDCRTEINGVKVRGACVTNQRMDYVFSKKRNYYEANKLELVEEIRNILDGNFSGNLRRDSLTILRLDKKVRINDFKNMLSYIELIQTRKDKNEDSSKYREKITLSKWDRKTLKLNNREMRRVVKFAKTTQSNQDSVMYKIANYVKEENKYFKVSSLVEWLKISIEVNGINYQLFQNNLGGVNASWELQIDDEVFYIISPELNYMISSFLPNQMQAKSRIKQIFEIKELEKAFSKDNKVEE